MTVKKITKAVTVNKVLSNEIVKIDKILPKKVLSKIATTSKDDWKNHYKNLSPSINSVVHNIDQRKIFIVM